MTAQQGRQQGWRQRFVFGHMTYGWFECNNGSGIKQIVRYDDKFLAIFRLSENIHLGL